VQCQQDGKAQNVEEFINSLLHGLESDCVGKVDKLLGVTQVGESTIPQYLLVGLRTPRSPTHSTC
jgi:hypothetical protein